MEEDGELSVSVAVLERKSLTVPRQSTTVPKTSVSSALGGLVRDIATGKSKKLV